MAQIPYPYKQIRFWQYIFISTGNKQIAKGVHFTPLAEENIVNLSFGDLLPDNSIDDRANSNNGDIRKVLSTVIDIIRYFTSEHPKMIAYFDGSTDERKRLYSPIKSLPRKKRWRVLISMKLKGSSTGPANPSPLPNFFIFTNHLNFPPSKPNSNLPF